MNIRLSFAVAVLVKLLIVKLLFTISGLWILLGKMVISNCLNYSGLETYIWCVDRLSSCSFWLKVCFCFLTLAVLMLSGLALPLRPPSQIEGIKAKCIPCSSVPLHHLAELEYSSAMIAHRFIVNRCLKSVGQHMLTECSLAPHMALKVNVLKLRAVGQTFTVFLPSIWRASTYKCWWTVLHLWIL